MVYFNSILIFTIFGVICEFIYALEDGNINEQMAQLVNPYENPNDHMIERIIEQQGQLKSNQLLMEQPRIDVRAELEKLNSTYNLVPTWPTSNRILGVVSAVSFDNSGNVVIFHRSNNLWDSSTFNQENVYQHQSNGPIKDNTIIAFNRISGDVAYEWGNNMFYMPHGITVDREDNIWLTDVALHQVMKFNDKNRTHPEFVLGTQFKPGHSHTTFCKPTAVAVIANGDFFVADGYCNSRIIKYSKSGEFLLEWGKNSFGGPALNHAPPNYFAIPHALTLANDLNLLCVADRENGRVQCFNIDDGKFHFQFHSPIIGDRLFSVAYAPVNNGQLFVVNGPSLDSIPHPVVGFVIDMKSHDVISKFGPFENPHDIIVSLDGQEVYVAQLNPNKAFKFVGYSISNQTNSAVVTPTDKANSKERALTTTTTKTMLDYAKNSERMFYIVASLVSSICFILFISWLVARQRRSAKANTTDHNAVEYNKLLSQC